METNRFEADRARIEDAVSSLAAYARCHQDIGVSLSGLHVPPDEAGGFACALDDAAAQVLEAVLEPGVLQASDRAACELRDAVGRLSGCTGGTQVRLPARLQRFADDARAEVASRLNGLVRRALCTGDAGAIVEEAAGTARSQAVLMERYAYEAWLFYELLFSLEPTRLMGVAMAPNGSALAVDRGYVELGAQIFSPEMRIPEGVVQTPSGTYAYKCEVSSELDHYHQKIVRRRDSTAAGDTAGVMAHRTMLLFKIPDADRVPLITDRQKKIYREPDLMVEHLIASEVEQDAFFGSCIGRVAELSPSLGCTVVLRPKSDIAAKDACEMRLEQARNTPGTPRFCFASVDFDRCAVKGLAAGLREL